MSEPTPGADPAQDPARRGTLVAGYMLAPADPAGEEELFAGLADLGVAGLEHALPPEGSRSLEPGWLERNVRPEWDLLVSLVPTVVPRLTTDPAYGLSSTDPGARARALADVARARDLALSLADGSGRRRVVGIELHSAPGPRAGSLDALARSLEEVLSWDLAGAEVVLEHCDALVPGRTPAKGFWPLEEEIALVQGFGLPADRLGTGFNWGRSAIEGRGPALALEHVRTLAAEGLLRSVVFSGATGEESPWSPAWADTHIPPRGDDPALAISAPSLLGPEEVLEALRAAGDVPHVGLKVAVRPEDADVATRLAVARACLALVEQARALV
ncbi:DUF4862 family protein [Kineococcus sp. SYSU DK006]|uniref:DUF4862 family protein n=1 Tax=Kineococcus sp. SYSU DK006 TaxID=3383127 RepID=UPI003D7D6F5B